MNYNFNVEIATKIGVDEAIMLNNFVYWLAKNKANNTKALLAKPIITLPNPIAMEEAASLGS